MSFYPIPSASGVSGRVLASQGTAPPSWVTASGGGGGAVDSVFGRTGAVSAATGDYTFTQISGRPSTYTPSAHTHPVTDIVGLPSAWTPSSHTHAVADVVGLPSTWTPSSHTHSAADITVGTLALARITAGSDGQVLKTVAGVPTWSTDSEGAGGGGSDLTLAVVAPLSYATSPSVGTISTSLWSWSNTTVNINASAAETDLVAFNVPPNTLADGRMLRVNVVGQHQNNTGATRTVTLRVYYGAAAVYQDVTGTIAASATPRAMRTEAVLRSFGATNRQVMSGLVNLSAADAVTAGVAGGIGAAEQVSVPFVALPQVDSTSTQSFRITLAHSVNSSTISTTVYGWTAELI